MVSASEITPSAVARSLLTQSVRLKRGETVIVESWNHSLPYASACVVEARRIGAHPMLLLEDEGAYWRSIDEAPRVARWSKVGRHEWAALAEADAYVFFPGPADRPRFRQLPTSRTEALTTYNTEWYRRAKKARLRGVRSVLGYASDPQAAFWGVSAATWRGQLAEATVRTEYRSVVAEGRRAADKLRKGKSLHISGPNGTDVRLRLRGRAPVLDDGVVTPDDLSAGQNLTVSPPGSITVAIDETSAEGTLITNRPSFLRFGRVEGAQWEIARGRLKSFWYNEGQPGFESAYRAAPKGRDVVSLFSIGLNPRLAPGVPQVEDQEGGAITLAIGGNRAYGGTNTCPWVSWVVLGEATVAVDDEPLCDRGKLL